MKAFPLNCRHVYCGKDALDHLAVGALVQRSKELAEAPRVHKATEGRTEEQVESIAPSTRQADIGASEAQEEASSSLQEGMLQAVMCLQAAALLM